MLHRLSPGFEARYAWAMGSAPKPILRVVTVILGLCAIAGFGLGVNQTIPRRAALEETPIAANLPPNAVIKDAQPFAPPVSAPPPKAQKTEEAASDEAASDQVAEAAPPAAKAPAPTEAAPGAPPGQPPPSPPSPADLPPT